MGNGKATPPYVRAFEAVASELRLMRFHPEKYRTLVKRHSGLTLCRIGEAGTFARQKKQVARVYGMMYSHTVNIKEILMSVAKIAITLDQDILGELDRLVRRHVFPNRSRAIQEAVREKVVRLSANRLAHECAKLDPQAEQALAEEGMSKEAASWPEY